MDEKTIRVAELFAGVGGFRLVLDGYHSADHPEFEKPAAGPYQTVWANQWEPPGTESKQFAWRRRGALRRAEEDYVPDEQLGQWRWLKGSKRIPRVNKRTDHEYMYSEGAMAFPDLLENPSRTILTGEGGKGASRFKHIIQCPDGRYRRLVPDELDQLQGFPKR